VDAGSYIDEYRKNLMRYHDKTTSRMGYSTKRRKLMSLLAAQQTHMVLGD